MKIAIVCGSPTSEFLAPFDDPEWQIWVLGNRLNRFADKRVTRAFEIHDNLSEHKDPAQYAEWLVSKNIPLVVGEKFPCKADHVQVFDYQQSLDLYGSLYLTSSPAYMMSQAISEGATHIGIYGVDLAIDNHEYFWQRPCMEAWIGFAKGRGIEISLPSVSPVGHSPYVEGRDWDGKKNNYGKGGALPFIQSEFEAMAETHAAKIAQKEAQIRQLEADIHTHSGAEQAYSRLAKIARAKAAGNDIKSLTDSVTIK